jgi:Bacterial Ig-like domain (group 3)/Beta-propeller repeat
MFSRFAWTAGSVLVPVFASLSTAAALPLTFEKNEGQFHSSVDYLVRAQGHTIALASDRAAFMLPTGSAEGAGVERITLSFVSAAANAPQVAGTLLEQRSNYFIGTDRSAWRTDVPHYSAVTYRNVYPGIDIVHYASESQLEYDFVAAPGADLSRVAMRFDGASSVKTDDEGHLLISTKGGVLKQLKPKVYQVTAAKSRTAVEASYSVTKDGLITIRLGKYDKTKAITIDPVIAFSTYLGGNRYDELGGFAVDAAGNSYVTGSTQSAIFPLVNPLDGTLVAGSVTFVSKLNKSGSAVVYSTYIGGATSSAAAALALGADGSVYFGGTAGSGLPTTAGVVKPTNTGATTGYVARLAPAGNSLVFSTYYGVDTKVTAVAPNADGSVVVAGSVGPSGSITTTAGATFTANRGGFLLRLNSTASSVQFGTYFDSITAAAVDSSGNMYVTGSTQNTDLPVVNALQSVKRGGLDAFVTKFAPAGSIVFSTYYGGDAGTGTPSGCINGDDGGTAIAVDANGNVVVTGYTAGSVNLVTNRQWGTGSLTETNAFLVKLAPAGNSIVYAGVVTTGGAFGCSHVRGLALDSGGNAHIAGQSIFFYLPTIGNLQLPTGDFVLAVDPTGTAFLSTTVPADRVGVDALGNIYAATVTTIPWYYTTSAYQDTLQGQQDIFITKFSNPRAAVTIATSNATIEHGQTVTLTATVQSVPSPGTINFMDGSTTLGSVPVSGSSAVLNISNLGIGIRKLHAQYVNVDLPQPISSSSIYQVVNQPAVCP